MNAARRRAVPDGLPNRVYSKSGSYYWFPKGAGWIKLCRVEDGELRMLERLAEEKRKHEPAAIGSGNVPPLVDEYVRERRKQHREKSWPLYGNYVKNGFADVNIDQVDNAMVVEFLRDNYEEKLHMKRIMRAFMTGFFQWCREKRYLVGENPCNGIRLKVPKVRDVYITHEHFAAIRAQLTNPMMLCFVDLCYLTVQRSTEIRVLRWKKEGDESSWVDRDNCVIHFRPSKTRDSSGIAVDLPISPEIDAVLEMARSLGKVKGPNVIHKRNGSAWTASGALKAWREACNRANLQEFGYTIKDIRAKALTDARRAGYDVDALQVAAAHADKATTEIYFKDRDVPVSNVRLAIPKSA
ncbi:tyrosine-type recombinase/integrase [Paraburkholderia sp. CNPSo 3274]|uniref:tyrosine-type recombinase/integrase n=1 Tax=Paraburkholderia sp. CNPSo 3274 TaxID=2940932 RepID=UPI0020B85DC0|nr:tyrosine-type recombinase/integrase [Paraburkholderia sp. CNPSo 3274]MCP3709774.1 tyrosine-type recombinase/integrase [Paraburkholderia sp. CNPSo 3274]